MLICECRHLEALHHLVATDPEKRVNDPTIVPNRRQECTMCACDEFSPRGLT